MTTKAQLLRSVQETKEKLSKLEQELAQCKTPTIQEASVGDVLEDGSIVLLKGQNHAILVSPKETEFESTWYTLEENKTKAFQGLNPLEWFIPTQQLLYLAYQNIPDHFQKRWYWSSSESSASGACSVGFNYGDQNGDIKSNTPFVRAFRCVTY